MSGDVSGKLRVAICPDFREEGWPSMDRVADALAGHLAEEYPGAIDAALVAPAFRRRASRALRGHAAANFDRGLNRLWDYPRHVQALASQYDVFHVIDHSYSQLVHRLPASRTVVTCHDLDTFRSLFEPEREARSAPFKAMTRHILAGLTSAATVTCDTAAVRDELVARELVASRKIVVAPIGVSDEFSAAADREADVEAARLIDAPPGAVEILHVGSVVGRKRIDTLLQVVARVRAVMPSVHLVRVGGEFTATQKQLADELGLTLHLSVLPTLTDRLLAAVYRRAALVLLPSEREGFGLPVAEAMVCGTPVVASDLPVLREVGGGAAEHCPPGDIEAWTARVLDLLRERDRQPERWSEREARGTRSAARYTWSAFARTMAGIYAQLSSSIVNCQS